MTGDLVQDGGVAAYERFCKLFSTLEHLPDVFIDPFLVAQYELSYCLPADVSGRRHDNFALFSHAKPQAPGVFSWSHSVFQIFHEGYLPHHESLKS